MDDDSWLHPDIFQPLLHALKSTDGAFMAEAHVRFIRDDGYMGPTHREQVRPLYHLSLIECEAGVCFERETFFKLGGWNEHIHFGGEGNEFSLRAFYQGYFGIMSMKSVAFHPSASLKSKQQEIQGKKKALTLQTTQARCRIARMDWPWLPAIGCIVKSATLSAFQAMWQFKDPLLGLRVSATSLVTLFARLPRCPHISNDRFWLFRQRFLTQQPLLEIIPGSRDYRDLVFNTQK